MEICVVNDAVAIICVQLEASGNPWKIASGNGECFQRLKSM